MRSFFAAIAGLAGDGDPLEQVLAGAGFGIFVDHPEHGCIYANEHLLRMFEMDWEAFRGFGWARAVLPEDMESLRDAIARFEHGRDTIEVQYRIATASGDDRVVHAYGQAVVDGKGAHVGSIVIARDVTVERAMADRAQQSQKLEAIGTLAGRVAHDFNNILTPIMFSASLLQREQLSPSARECAESIQVGVEHAAAITRDLLSLSGHRVYERSVARIDEEIRSKARLLQQLVGEQVKLYFEYGAEGLAIPLAPHALAQIVLNLLVNARDAMQGRGTVRIETSHPGERVELRVVDDGAGMTPEVQRALFEPFFTTKAEGCGTGLGLFSVRELVKRAGGTIDVSSRPGVGTAFRIGFETVAADEALPPAPAAGAKPKSCRVLVVDDNDALRQTLAYVLALGGHEVKASADVARAKQLLDGETFDVLVTDLMLPDGRGSELAAHARGRHPCIGVIYMSGFSADEDAAADVDRARTLFLPKPFPPARLTSALAAVLG